MRLTTPSSSQDSEGMAIMSRRNLTMAGLYASAAFLMAAKSIMYLRKKFINFSVKNG